MPSCLLNIFMSFYLNFLIGNPFTSYCYTLVSSDQSFKLFVHKPLYKLTKYLYNYNFYLNRKLVATRLVFSETVRINALLFASFIHCILFHFILENET